jgi:uncharacterized protein YcgL (UPF0745 family)
MPSAAIYLGRQRDGLLPLPLAPMPVRPLILKFQPTGVAMHCFVYASLRKPDAYLWLKNRDDFACMPESLALMLGELRFALEVELSGHRKLPYEDAQQVMEHLRDQGWHLQLPPQQTLSASNHPDYKTAPQDRSRDR